MQEKRRTSQRGAALVVSMVLLLLLTLLGSDGMRTSMLSMHLSKGFQDRNYAFQFAETGLRLAEALLESTVAQDDVSSALGSANIGYETGSVDHDDESYWDGFSDYSTNYPVKIVVKQWRFVPDSLAVGGENQVGITYYQVTARGVDPGYSNYLQNGNSEDINKSRSVVVLQSVYAVRHTN